MRSNKRSRSTPTLISNNAYYSTDESKASLFANQLSTTFSPNEEVNFDKNHHSKVHDWFNKIKEKFKKKANDKFLEIKIEDVNCAIKELKMKDSLDKEGLSYTMLKKLPEVAKHHLCDLFNNILKSNEIQTEWKTASITMLFKNKGPSSDPKGYRPISITSVLFRLLEKIMGKRYTQFFKDNNILIAQQSGFRAHRQTKDNILLLCQKAIEAFNRGKKVVALFYDVEGAFDKVWHEGLIWKLAELGQIYN